jgi:hypothetical protein
MVRYSDNKPLPPFFANALKSAPRADPKLLTFSRLRGNFVSKHVSGKSVTVVEVLDSFGFCLALLFATPLNEDLDGAPTTFAPPTDFNNLAPQNGLHALDDIRNATNEGGKKKIIFHQNGTGNTFTWTGVKSSGNVAGANVDPRDFLGDVDGNFPKLQPATSPTHDFYAPRTAMDMPDGQAVNPLTVAYAVLRTSLRDNGHVALGDVGVAVRPTTGASSTFLYGDAGGKTSTSVGECSRMMIQNLFNGPASSEDICYIVFPGVSSGAVAHPELVDPLVRDRLSRLAKFSNFQSIASNMLIPLVVDRATALTARAGMAANERGRGPVGVNPYFRDDGAYVDDTVAFSKVVAGLRLRGFAPPP